jgi:hypothetical protein
MGKILRSGCESLKPLYGGVLPRRAVLLLITNVINKSTARLTRSTGLQGFQPITLSIGVVCGVQSAMRWLKVPGLQYFRGIWDIP